MRKTLLALTLAAPFAAAAQPASGTPERGFTAHLQERYCDKLRESPEAYVRFVRRLAPIHGYTYADFAPSYPGAPVKADCRVNGARIAAVWKLLGSAS
jgi:hypothetical protein